MIKIKDCRYGPMMYLDNDTYIGRSLDKYGESLFHESQFMKQIVSKGDVFIDVGANFGSITVPLAKAVGPTGYVVAIEAQPHIFNMLCGTLALNELHQVQPLNRAAANEDGQIAYLPEIDYGQKDSFGSIFLRQEVISKKVRPIPTMTIDSMQLSPRLIKIDVEGMEPQVLEGCVQTIERSKPVLFVELMSDEERIIQFMKDIDYDIMILETPLFNEYNTKDKEDVFVDDEGNSIVCLNLVGWHKNTQLGASSRFLYDICKSPFPHRHDVYKEMKERIYGS